MFNPYHYLRKKLFNWLTYEPPSDGFMPFDFSRLKYEIRPGDVLLIEGRSRISKIINRLTLSQWTHAALYIGRLIDYDDEATREAIRKHIKKPIKDNTRLVIEDLIDKGTVVSSLNSYRHHHIRICRPIGIAPNDVFGVIRYAIKALGQTYNIRQMLDLLRYLLPWTLLPRRWGSSLFRTSTGEPDPGVCSSLIAEAFLSVQFPVLTLVKVNGQENSEMEVFPRNPYLYTPKDFDVSPYFEIIKYPLFNPEEPLPYYRRLPWAKNGVMYQDNGILSSPTKKNDDEDGLDL